MNSSTGQPKKQHKRIPNEKQQQLIQLVFKQQWRIKQAATFLKIIYASAKNVISRYRKTMILKKPIMKKNAKRCHYKKLTYQNPQIQIICLNGGFQRK